ncbi:hypothetical protein [Clostridium botulinum]|nr:hypothetical protein [Clostridium botulinum]
MLSWLISLIVKLCFNSGTPLLQSINNLKISSVYSSIIVVTSDR